MSLSRRRIVFRRSQCGSVASSRRKRFEIQVRRPTGKGRRPIGRDTNELKALGEHLAIAGFDLVGEQEEQMRLLAIVGRIDKDSALTEEVAVLFQ